MGQALVGDGECELQALDGVDAPGVDPARVHVMRDALQATYRDPAFLEEAKVMNLEFQPKTPDQIQQILSDVLATPPEIAAKYRHIIQP